MTDNRKRKRKFHELKTWPKYFEDILQGEKTFEVRKNDRGFKKNDILILKEYDPENEIYSGREGHYQVAYIIEGGQFGIEPGFCVMAIEEIGFEIEVTFTIGLVHDDKDGTTAYIAYPVKDGLTWKTEYRGKGNAPDKAIENAKENLKKAGLMV